MDKDLNKNKVFHLNGWRIISLTLRDGSGSGESGYSSKPVSFGLGMDYTYWTVDVYGDTCINPRVDGLTLTPTPSPSPLLVK